MNTTRIELDTHDAQHKFDGIGGLSAGASSRLLWDYDEPQRSEVLDYLFKPNFGANLHICKVEIGGSGQSTDGDEASIEDVRGKIDCSKGYENWLMLEAKKRNPSVLTYGLSWAVPAWVGENSTGYFSDDGIKYHIDWLDCVKETVGIDVDYMGVWNERVPQPLDWIVELRRAMDDAGYSYTKIVAPDNKYVPSAMIAGIVSNKTVRDALYATGTHYPCNEPYPYISEAGLQQWSSEDYSSDAPGWVGGPNWGRVLVENYVRMNNTATIAWSTVWSVYENLVCQHAGLTRAMEPWSNHYDVDAPLWTSAHIAQFAQPGFRFLGAAPSPDAIARAKAKLGPKASVQAALELAALGAPGSGTLQGGGAYVTLYDEPSDKFAFVVETLTSGGRCEASVQAKAPQQVQVVLAPGMPGSTGGTSLAVWRTTEQAQFVRMPDVKTVELPGGQGAAFNLTVFPDAMYTVSNQEGQKKGTVPSPPPASAPFPIPYAEDFSSPGGGAGTNNTLIPRYISDQYGVFEIHEDILPSASAPAGGPPGRGSVGGSNPALVQVLPKGPGRNGWAHASTPATIVGGLNASFWSDYTVEVDAFLPAGGAGARLEASLDSTASYLRAARGLEARRADASRRRLAGAASRAQGTKSPGDYLVAHPHLEGIFESSTGRGAAGSVDVSAATGASESAAYPTYGDMDVKRSGEAAQGALRDSPGSVVLAPCVEGGSPYQTWKNGTEGGPLYLENEASLTCMNSDGCLAPIITYTCLTQGGTCCGADCYKGLQFTYDPEDKGIRGLVHDNCLTIAPEGSSTYTILSPCGAPLPPSQQWDVNEHGQIRSLAGDGTQCLGTPMPESFIRLCGRVQSLNGFQGYKTAVCLTINSTSDWRLEDFGQKGPTVIASGSLPAPVSSRVAAGPPSGAGGLQGTWMHLKLAFEGTKVSPEVSGASLGHFDTTVPSGLVLLGSGFETSGFDNLMVTSS